MKETSHVTRSGCERQRGDLARVHALEHGHAWIVSEPWMQLAVADVERDDALRAPLEEDVREASRRGADVDGATPADV